VLWLLYPYKITTLDSITSVFSPYTERSKKSLFTCTAYSNRQPHRDFSDHTVHVYHNRRGWTVWEPYVILGSWWGNRKEGDHWEDLGVDGWIMRIDLQEVECGYMDWIGLAQDRDRWRTLVSAVMNLRVPWNAGISWLAANQLASQEGLCTTEWVSK